MKNSVAQKLRLAAGKAIAGLALGSVALFTSSPAALADTFPARPIRLMIGFPPGGPSDIPGRAIATKLSEQLATPVIVENKPGAGSMLAVQEMLAQPRDGHTLLVCTYFDPVNTLLYRKARYKVEDIAPVSMIGTYDYVLAVANTVPASSVKQLVELTKAEPQRFNYGHIGTASPANLIFKVLERTTGLTMTAVPFKGSAPATQEVIAGRLDLYIVPPISATEPYAGKLLKILAATGKARVPALPDVPTLQELGIPVVFFAFVGICAGTGTPQSTVDKLNAEVRKAVASPDYKELMQKLGSVAVSSTPLELQTLFEDSIREARPIINAFNLASD